MQMFMETLFTVVKVEATYVPVNWYYGLDSAHLPERQVEVLTPRTSQYDSIWK